MNAAEKMFEDWKTIVAFMVDNMNDGFKEPEIAAATGIDEERVFKICKKYKEWLFRDAAGALKHTHVLPRDFTHGPQSFIRPVTLNTKFGTRL